MSATSRSAEELETLVADLRRRASDVIGDPEAMETPSMPLRGFDRAELGLIRLSSWLYSLHRESGKEAIEYLVELLEGNGRDACSEHVATVEVLRTYFQHHLTSSPRDSRIRSVAEEWLADAHGEFDPDSDAHWSAALRRLVEEALNALRVVDHGLQAVRDPGLREVFADQWAARKARVLPAHEVDDLIEFHAGQMGLDQLNVKSFREQHNGAWQRLLRVGNVHTDPREYLAGLIERELLKFQEVAPLPVKGDDVMDAFGIGPGPEVGQILRTIATLHTQHPDSKEALLRRAASLLGKRLYTPAEQT